MISRIIFQVFHGHEFFLFAFDYLSTILVAAPLTLFFILWFYDGLKKNHFDWYIFFEVCLGLLLALLISEWLIKSFPELRPISYYYPQFQSFDSFPSRHTLFITTLAFVVFYNYFDFGLALIFDSILVGLLRILSLRHWPFDVLTGWVLGFLIALVAIEAVKFVFRRKTKKVKTKIKAGFQKN